MFGLKLQMVNCILVNGKKSINEKKIKNIIKKLIKNNKKNSIFLLQLIVNLSFLVFRPDNANFFTYFFTDSSRVSFALKQVFKYYLLNKNIKFTFLEFTEMSLKFTNLRKNYQFYTTTDNKLIHFYRW